MRLIYYCVTICTLFFSAGCVNMNERTIVPTGKTVCIEELPNSLGLKYCVDDLKTVFQKIGVKVVENEPADTVFKFEIDSDYKLDELPNASITKENNKLLFHASTKGALNYLIYSYIKDHLGAEWFMPETEVVVFEDDMRDPFLEKDKKVDYRLPFYISTQYWGGDLRWHNRMRNLKEKEIYVYHNWKRLVPSDQYFESNPEYFALVNGERDSRQLCTTNKDVIEIAAQKCVEFFDKNPNAYAYSLSPNDMYGFCGCDNCRVLDQQAGSITDRLVVFFNEVAGKVTEKYPKKKLAFYAYLNYTDLPKLVKPHPAVIPVVCRTPWEFCHNHGITDKKCRCNKRFREILEGWVKLCPEVYVREYYGHFLWYGFWPILHTLQDDFEYYKKIGVKGVISESHEHWGINPWVLYGAGRYLAGENGSWKIFVDRYCRGVFPNVSGLMKKLIFLLEEKTESVPCKRMDLVFDDNLFSHIERVFEQIHKKNITRQERENLLLLEYGFQLTKQLVKVARSRSQGDIGEMSESMDDVFSLIYEMENDTKLPVVKYKLVKRVLGRFSKIYQNENDVFLSFFLNNFNVELDKPNKGYMLRNWLMSKCYPNKIKDIDYVPMVAPILDETLVIGLDETLPENTKWKKTRYDESYYSLYEFFPFRPDSVRFYRTCFKLKKAADSVIAVRAVDGYKISLDGSVLGLTKQRRFSKKQLFDYYEVSLPEGSHQIELLLEGSRYLEKDDFTVIVFDRQGNPADIME